MSPALRFLWGLAAPRSRPRIPPQGLRAFCHPQEFQNIRRGISSIPAFSLMILACPRKPGCPLRMPHPPSGLPGFSFIFHSLWKREEVGSREGEASGCEHVVLPTPHCHSQAILPPISIGDTPFESCCYTIAPITPPQHRHLPIPESHPLTLEGSTLDSKSLSMGLSLF